MSIGDSGPSLTPTTFSGGKGGNFAKSILIPLCIDKKYITSGTTTFADDVYDVPQLRNIGPMISKIRAHVNVEDATGTNNFKVRVNLAWSILGRVWSTPTDILASQVGNTTSTISGWLSDDTKFGLQLRAAVGVCNVSAGGSETARVSVILEVELKS